MSNDGEKGELLSAPPEPVRIRLPDERKSLTHKFCLRNANAEIIFKDGVGPQIAYSDIDGYITVGFYPDGKIGEIFLTVGKIGGALKIYECLMTAISIGLQYGISLDVFAQKFMHMQFDPSGVTSNTEIPMAKSILDYVFRWLKMKFDDGGENESGRCGKEVTIREKDEGGASSV